jgi:hypothetical protein
MRASALTPGPWNAKAPMRAEAGADANSDKAIAADMMMRDIATSNEPMLTDWSPAAQTWFRREPRLSASRSSFGPLPETRVRSTDHFERLRQAKK